MKILVTGGAGFIGSNFVRYCLKKANAIGLKGLINLDLLTYAGNLTSLEDLAEDPIYEFVQGDIGDAKLLEELLASAKPDIIVNFAAESHVDRSIDSPEPFFQTNVIGTLRLLDNANRHFNSLADADKSSFRFLHVSTDEVYGSLSNDDPAFAETNQTLPNSPYAASKAASDHIVRAYHHTFDFPVLTTNCSNNYGPYQFPEKLIPLMILNAMDERDLPIYGDGMNIRDWLYVEDHCEAIMAVIQKGTLGETYNIGGNCEKPNIEIVDSICGILDELKPRSGGDSYSELKTYVKDRPGHDRRYAINAEKIRTEIGWEPKENFAGGIEKTIRWYMDNRAWCDAITDGTYQRQRLGNA